MNRSEAAEKPGDRTAALVAPSVSYTLTPLASGPAVFAVFEGRSPCQGIARELKIDAGAGCIKTKWRVTLYQDPETRTPTTYKVEGSLYRPGRREGKWSIIRGTATDPNTVVYRLEPTKPLMGGARAA